MNTEETFTLDIGKYLTLGYLEQMSLSQNELARNLGVPSSRINSIGHTKITLDTNLRLCKFFEKTEGFFLHVQEELDRR
jgi:addiction module HigA family antidote